MKTIENKPIIIGKKYDLFNQSFSGINLAIIFSILAFLSQGQKITYDSIPGKFTHKRITGLSNQSVNHKSNYLIRLDDFNTALYKVQFKFNDFDWETEPPAILEQYLHGLESITLSDKALFEDKRFRALVDFKDSSIQEADLVEKLNKIIRFIDEYPNTIKDIKLDEMTLIKDASEKGLKDLGFKSTDYSEELNEFQNDIFYVKGLYNALKEFNAESPNSKFEYVQTLASMEGVINKLNSKNYPKLLSYIISFAKEAPKNYAKSDIHFPEKEVTTLQIIVINRFDPTDTICNYSTDIYRTGVFKIDFSTGIGVNSLVKPTYSMANNGSPYIHKENGRDADLSVMALLHANWRLSRNFTFGPTAGVSVSTFDANTGFVLGISGSFGTRNTISLSTGGIMGKSYKLSSRVSSDGNKADIPLESGMTEVPKVDAVNYGWFVSVTYNLTRIKKKP
ncbi:hypothetical protein [Fluviicola chungangensis]|uniref:Uncharacterized protein n=1 Tax=Fluviicola chungangensis TaxID=2597671 RepID=A0A556MZN2_9FLAO|nr:hypothetical protein [Fluviicola chungangensis]TSJ45380.1 hypothetical protein FO442_06410 [Fluviicola chungangensis]